MRKTRILIVATLAAIALAPQLGAHAAAIPSSMSSLGDSITRGFNACGWFVDCTNESWSTGGDSYVNSHYLRILAKNSAIRGKNYNDAKTGAKMVDLNGQATTAGNRGVQYVTILMGANDVCTSSESTMTAATTVHDQFLQAIQTLEAKIPHASIFVASVPNIWQLWNVGHTNSSAVNTWNAYGICQSMLANPTSTAQADVDRRARVKQRNIDDNTQLANVCAQYANCKWDGNAVFNYAFSLNMLTTWDYFHPNTLGQQNLAKVSYAAGYNW